VQKGKALFSVVYDCMIFLQGLLSESGIAVSCFELFESGVVELFISEEVLAEIQDVITRPKLQAKYSRLTNERTKKLIETLRTKATIIKNVPQVFSYTRDPKDEKYINLAVACDAKYIISRDSDLLDLMTSYDVESKEFRQKTRPLCIIEPLEFLKIVEEKQKENLGIKP
jgi:putative PIN family toxin of toxin-antitoxin system